MTAAVTALARPQLVSHCPPVADRTGSLRHYDDLGEALAAYNSPDASPAQRTARLHTLRDAARLCGWSPRCGLSVSDWAAKRLGDYRNLLGAG